jgi:hypothetical protein
MTKEEGYLKYKNKIDYNSTRWNISTELICAIIYQASKFDEDKEVFDKEYFEKSIEFYNIPEDEKKWRATKIGLVQMTGQKARECGYREKREDFNDPMINIYFACKFWDKVYKVSKDEKKSTISVINMYRDRNEDKDFYKEVKKYEEEFKSIVNG